MIIPQSVYSLLTCNLGCSVVHRGCLYLLSSMVTYLEAVPLQCPTRYSASVVFPSAKMWFARIQRKACCMAVRERPRLLPAAAKLLLHMTYSFQAVVGCEKVSPQPPFLSVLSCVPGKTCFLLSTNVQQSCNN